MNPTIFNLLIVAALILAVIAMVRPIHPLLALSVLLIGLAALLDRRRQ